MTALPLTALAALFLSACGDGIPDYTAEELAETTAQVREAFNLQDYEYGAELGERWVAWAPEALELKAWTVANLAKGGSRGLAKSLAAEMQAADAESPWSAFALTAARIWSYDRDAEEETLAASERAFLGLPDRVEAALLRGEALSMLQGPDSTKAFLDALPEELRSNVDVRAFVARESFPRELEPADSALDAVLVLFREILETDPDHIQANIYASSLLEVFKNEPERAFPHLERAAALTPSPYVHGGLWNGIFSRADLSDAEKRASVTEDVRQIVATAGESPARWAALARWLEGMDLPELQAELEDRVLDDHPRSRAAEVVLANRYQSARREIWGAPPSDEAAAAGKRVRLSDMLTDFIDRRQHQDPELLLDAHWTRFLLGAEDPGTDPAALAALATDLAAYMETEPGSDPASYYAIAARTLAEHPETLAEARRFIGLSREALETDRADPEAESPDTEASPDEEAGEEEEETPSPTELAEDAMLSAVTGLVLLQEGRLEEAEEELAQARNLDTESYASSQTLLFAYLYSGRLMERRAELAQEAGTDEDRESLLQSADEYYLEGVRQDYYPYPAQGLPWVNPNQVALESLYQKRNGNLDGFEAYLLTATDEGWEERRDRILARRIQDPEPMQAFALETLEGEEVLSESYLGKVVIINFWGTW